MREFAFFVGKNPGPTTVILGGVHGHEHMSLQAVREAADELKRDLGYRGLHSGRVLFLEGNPEAVRQGKRFIDVNLNRQFTDSKLVNSYDTKVHELRVARSLYRLFGKADFLLDLHTSDEATPPFLICDQPKKILEPYLNWWPEGVEYILTGLDYYHPGSTDGYMNKKGKLGFCIECGQKDDPKSKDVGKDAIYRVLFNQHHFQSNYMIPAFRESPKVKTLQASYIHNCSFDFEPYVSCDEFTLVSEGDLMGWDGGVEVHSPHSGVVIWVDLCNEAGEEAFVIAQVV